MISRVQHLELTADRRWGYGFTIRGIFPTHVDSVDPPGPAYQAGVRPESVQSCLFTKYSVRMFEHATTDYKRTVTVDLECVGSFGGQWITGLFRACLQPVHKDLNTEHANFTHEEGWILHSRVRI